MNRNRVYGAAIAAALALAAPASSEAAQRYASPSGFGLQCTQKLSCLLDDAVTKASAHDEVIVQPGDYTLTKTLDTPDQVSIHGVARQPRPQITFSGSGLSGLGLGVASTLTYVEIDGDSGALRASKDSLVDQAVLHGSGTDQLRPVADLHNSTLRNSIVVASGQQGVAVTATTKASEANFSVLRNVTAVAPAIYGVAVQSYATGAGASGYTNIHNTIASGGPGGEDVEAYGTNGGKAHVTAFNSNFDNSAAVGDGTVPPAGQGNGNQPALPLFVDAAKGDYHEKAGSPTIDKGATGANNGPYDVDGDKRAEATTDIGADEYQPPKVPPTKPSNPGGPKRPGSKADSGRPPVTQPGDTLAPTLSGLSFRRKRFRFRVSEAASVRVTISRRRHGRYRRVGSFTIKHAAAGRNRVRFRGRLRIRHRMRRLAAGRYRATLVAKDAAGNRSRARSVRLRVR